MNKKLINVLPFLSVITAWLFVYYQGVSTAISVWNVSEIFTHCFLVLPGAFYLIYQKRQDIFQQPIKPNYWLILPITGTLFLQTFGMIGDIRLFMHIATFSALPLIIWMMLGNQAAKVIAFPLYFILFTIPVGEQLIPYLQDLTTNLAVPLIELSGVPIYRNGLYLDIPEGRFLVAEACSGISFLIASVVFGHLYAYISFNKFSKQLTFVIISVVVPILANAIRVYGIVLTAHLTDMEYAAGADHIIYGGVFYGIVLFLLISIGEQFRDKGRTIKSTSTETLNLSLVDLKVIWRVSIIIIAIFLVQLLWSAQIEKNRVSLSVKPSTFSLDNVLETKQQKLIRWQPNFTKADDIQQGVILQNNNKLSIDFYIASYFKGEGKGELISSVNKLYSSERWTLVNQQKILIDQQREVLFTELASPTGKHRFIVYWYQIADKKFTSTIKAKLFHTSKLLMGDTPSSKIMAFSIESENNTQKIKAILIHFLQENSQNFNGLIIENKNVAVGCTSVRQNRVV